MSRWCVVAACCAVLAIAGIGAGEKAPDANAAVLTALDELRKSEKEAEPEFQEFARKIIVSIQKGDAAFLDESLDKEGFLTGISKSLNLTKDASEEVEKILCGMFDPNALKFGTQFAAAKKNVGSFDARLLRCVQDQEAVKAVIRYTGNGGTFNYLEFRLAKTGGANDKIVCTDLFDMAKGRLASVNLAQLLYSVLKSVGKNGRGESPFVNESKIAENLTPLVKVTKLVAMGTGKTPKSMVKDYYALPEKDRLNPVIQLAAYNLAQKIGVNGPEAKKLVGEMYDKNRLQPCLILPLIRALQTQKEWTKALECLAYLEHRYGPDSYSLIMQAYCYSQLKNTDNMVKTFDKALAAEPGNAEVYKGVMGYYVETKNNAKIKEVLLALKKNIPETDIKQLLEKDKEELKDFTKSPEYQELLKEMK